MAVYIEMDDGGTAHLGYSNRHFVDDLLHPPRRRAKAGRASKQRPRRVAPRAVAPRASEGNPRKIFLCHAKEDKPVIRRLYRRLKNDGYDPWLDEKNLNPGKEWKREIKAALKKSDFAVVCFSQASVNRSGFVHVELREILELAANRPFGKVFLIPARINDCELPDEVSAYQWVDLYKRNGYMRLRSTLDE